MEPSARCTPFRIAVQLSSWNQIDRRTLRGQRDLPHRCEVPRVSKFSATDVSRDGTPTVDERLLARFLEKAPVTGQLDHPGIVPIHELGLETSDDVGRVE